MCGFVSRLSRRLCTTALSSLSSRKNVGCTIARTWILSHFDRGNELTGEQMDSLMRSALETLIVLLQFRSSRILSRGVLFPSFGPPPLPSPWQVCLCPLSDLNLHLSTAASGVEASSPSLTCSPRWTTISHFSPSPNPKEAAAQKSWMTGLPTPASRAQSITVWRQLPAPIMAPRLWTLVPEVGEGPRNRTSQLQIQEACLI